MEEGWYWGRELALMESPLGDWHPYIMFHGILKALLYISASQKGTL